jgi:hypothetical protein
MLLHMARTFVVNRAEGEKTRVHITTKVNAASIRREKLNGRDVIIVPSATLPDDVIMNGVLYPKDEIEKSYLSLENTFAPLGHPDRNGQFLSAFDPEAVNAFHVGAFNRNVRRENGRVLIDKVIDVETAGSTERGKRVLAAIEKGAAIHTSTGLYAIMEAANGDVPYNRIARDIIFDHDAILLDEPGAATPEQGVGMLVNAKGETEQVPVINSTFTEEADRGIDWAISHLVQAVHQKRQAEKQDTMMGKVKTAILALIGAERDTSTNREEDPVTPEQFAALEKKVDALANAKPVETDQSALAKAIADAVTLAIKPVTDQVEAMANAAKAKDEAELVGLRAKIVKAGIMNQAEADALTTLAAARPVAKLAEPGHAFALSNGFGGGNPAGDFDLPEGEA